MENNHFDLSAQEFRDALAIRYRKPLLNLPPKCDGCGAPSSLDHFLICRRGGLVVRRHNEIRDAIGDLAALAWGQVRRETVVIEAEDQQSETLIADLCVRGVWLPQAEALFDIRVVDTDAQSYLCHAPSRVLLNAEVEKKNKYAEACAARRAHFTPLCFSVDGLAGSEANCFFEAYGMQVEFSMGQKLCRGVRVDSCPIGFCYCASFSVVCAWFPHQMEKFGP